MTSSSEPKRARTTASSSSSPSYLLHYWPTIPGRGEPIRLCFEATSTPYTDVTNTNPYSGMKTLMSLISSSSNAPSPNIPHIAPPILQHGDLYISQLPNILLYLGPKLGLVPADDDNAIYRVNQLALTALDGLLNEAHDAHHPIAVGEVYENQKEEAIKRAKDYTSNRLPKFLNYFERVLKADGKGGEYLYGGQLTYADLVLFQGLDGVSFAFPNAVKKLRDGGEYKRTWELYERVKGLGRLKEYLGSDRRKEYGNGIWRYYEELDED
ncbi:MAG: hypothetical protein Q9168_003467 [Polycauliona sp. 1 TL-2023]